MEECLGDPERQVRHRQIEDAIGFLKERVNRLSCLVVEIETGQDPSAQPGETKPGPADPPRSLAACLELTADSIIQQGSEIDDLINRARGLLF